MKSTNKTNTELLRIIKNYSDENQLDDVLAELRDLYDTYNQSEIRELIEILSNKKQVCPICGNKLVYKTVKEKHPEVDTNNIEENTYLYCEDCGFEDLDN